MPPAAPHLAQIGPLPVVHGGIVPAPVPGEGVGGVQPVRHLRIDQKLVAPQMTIRPPIARLSME